jgi:nicotinamidase-related amidase
MPIINRQSSALLIVDFQSKLIPAIDDGMSVVANARRLLDAAEMLEVPILFTEQNADGLGSTLPELRSSAGRIAQKMTFDACRAAGFLEALRDRRDVIVSGCEAHVCVLQTVLAECRPMRLCCARRSRLAPLREHGDGNPANGAEWSGDRDHGDGNIRVAWHGRGLTPS